MELIFTFTATFLGALLALASPMQKFKNEITSGLKKASLTTIEEKAPRSVVNQHNL